ncbi:nucleoid occlusion protein [Halothermothrix orenii]|uniref:ParB-like partition protein n=1 Tax=Halothermothrix orenii (strain H 168 / OCM 544 / DSM 9562) TaxID=373903 RepID=B8D1E6_HALOH|nr:nucleoid occlusion protein [Halothermothrix orenii]ACL71098.1 parB-like partition protein [Halothermothrix orenii H 168]
MKLPFIQVDKLKDKDGVIMIPVDKIEPNPYQPRKDFKEEDLNELADSIKSYGVIQPITVRVKDDGYELIAGERRLRASRYLGLNEIPAVIKELTDREMAEIALVENLQRKDLNFMEEARAYQKLLEQFKLTQKELAQRLGKSQSTIANKLRLLSLSNDVQEQINSPLITERHARALLKLDNKEQQIKVIEEIKDKKLTVKQTEQMVNKLLDNKNRKAKVVTVYKDLRIFTNSLKKTINEMKSAGLEVKVDKEESDDFIEFKIRLPKKE